MDDRQQKWRELEQACESCERCGLHRSRNKLVFGKGSRDARILFVGEAPGEAEDAQGAPFVGRAGQLLDKYLLVYGFTLDNIYIANILKCRPPGNRDPDPAEQDACMEHLRAQAKLLQPKLIICLGRVAAARIIKPDFRITSEHGKWFEKAGILMTAIYHPSALLRDPGRKADALLDFKSAREKAGELGLI